MLLSIDGTFLIQILNFVVFWMLLNWLFIAPTRRAIEARQRIIAQQYAEAEAFRKQAEALQAEADGILDAARRSTAESLRDASGRAAADAHEIERRAAADATATVQLAHATVGAERADAVRRQQPLVNDLAQAMVQRAIDLEGVA